MDPTGAVETVTGSTVPTAPAVPLASTVPGVTSGERSANDAVIPVPPVPSIIPSGEPTGGSPSPSPSAATDLGTSPAAPADPSPPETADPDQAPAPPRPGETERPATPSSATTIDDRDSTPARELLDLTRRTVSLARPFAAPLAVALAAVALLPFIARPSRLSKIEDGGGRVYRL